MTNIQKQRLLTVKAQILAEPKMYDQREFGNEENPCGSPCCIAGWLVWNESPQMFSSLLKDGGMGDCADGLIAGVADRYNLFGWIGWPNELGYEVRWGKTFAIRAQAAAKMIDYVIEQESK